ncbi:MAG: hypothetical protein Q9224_007271, partial [Gallowayella concinna]
LTTPTTPQASPDTEYFQLIVDAIPQSAMGTMAEEWNHIYGEAKQIFDEECATSSFKNKDTTTSPSPTRSEKECDFLLENESKVEIPGFLQGDKEWVKNAHA